MNKRNWTWIIILFVVFDAIVFGVLGWWFLLRKPAAASKVFQMLPEQTLALLYIPDGEGSKTRWKETSLHKIWMEPSVQSLVAKPLTHIPDTPNLTLVRRAASTPGVKDFFVAITTLSPEPTVLIGLRVTEHAAEADKVFSEIETTLKEFAPEGTSGMETIGSQTFRSYTASGRKVVSTSSGEWRFWSNNADAIIHALGALKEGQPPAHPTLQDSAIFKKVTNIVPSLYDGLAYLNLASVRDRLLGLAATAPGSEDAVTAIKSLDALSISIGFSGPQIKEVIRIAGSPDSAKGSGKLGGDSLKFTSPDTVAFYETALGQSQFFNLEAIEKMASQSTEFAAAQTIVAKIREKGITTESISRTFGPEASVQLEWSKGMMQPRAFFRLGVQDEQEAVKIVDLLTKGEVWDAWKQRETKLPGATVYSMAVQPALMRPVLSLGLSKNTLVMGMSAKDVEAFLGRVEARGKTLEASEVYQEAVKQTSPDGSSYVFIDSRALFTQIYGSVKSALTMMNMFSGSSSALPVQKLPPTEDIAKHLHPFSMSTKVEGDVIRIESTGPITFSQSLLGMTAAATGVAFSQGMLGKLPIPGIDTLPLSLPDPGTQPEPAGP